jgi:tetratricopeptide (TPR) repeat protein
MWDEAYAQSKRIRSDKLLRTIDLTESKARIEIGRSHFEQALALLQSSPRGELGAVPLMVEAHLRLGKLERGAELAQRAIEAKRPFASFAMGAVQEAAGDLEAALFWYEQEARHIFSARGDRAPRAAARILMALGDYGEARIALRHTISRSKFLHPEDVVALAECLRRLGNESLAVKLEVALARRQDPVSPAPRPPVDV